MLEKACLFDYAVIRVVPRVEREEFINAGLILSCPAQKFLEARIELNIKRLEAFAPTIDAKQIQTYLETIPRICAGDASAGKISRLTERERFYWLTAQRSTIVQCSPIHTGFCDEAADMLEKLLVKTVK